MRQALIGGAAAGAALAGVPLAGAGVRRRCAITACALVVPAALTAALAPVMAGPVRAVLARAALTGIALMGVVFPGAALMALICFPPVPLCIPLGSLVLLQGWLAAAFQLALLKLWRRDVYCSITGVSSGSGHLCMPPALLLYPCMRVKATCDICLVINHSALLVDRAPGSSVYDDQEITEVAFHTRVDRQPVNALYIGCITDTWGRKGRNLCSTDTVVDNYS